MFFQGLKRCRFIGTAFAQKTQWVDNLTAEDGFFDLARKKRLNHFVIFVIAKNSPISDPHCSGHVKFHYSDVSVIQMFIIQMFVIQIPTVIFFKQMKMDI